MTEVPSRPVPGPRPALSSTSGTPASTGPDSRPEGEPPRPIPAPRAVPGPVPVPVAVPVGTPAALETALRPLDTLSARPVDEHPALFEAVHEALQRTLAESDS